MIIDGLKKYSWLIALLLPLIVFLIDTFRYCSQQERIEKIDFNSNSLNFRPYVELADSLGFVNLRFHTDTSWLKQRRLADAQNHRDEVIQLFMNSSITINPRIVNKSSNDPAYVLMSLGGDVPSNDLIWLNEVLNDKIDPATDLIYGDTPLYMKPNDTAYIFDKPYDLKLTNPENLENSEYKIHFLIIYANETNNYFYSYYIIQVRVPAEVLIPDELIDGIFKRYKHSGIQVKPDEVEIKKITFISKPFDLEQCKRIDTYYNIANEIKNFTRKKSEY